MKYNFSLKKIMEYYSELNPQNENEDELVNFDNKKTKTVSSSIIKHNNYSNSNVPDNLLASIQTNEINVENSTVIGTKLVETDNNDERYLKAIKQKGEIAILKGENKLIEIIKLETLEKILSLLQITLKEFYYDISFGIYSCEEIVELRKRLETNSSLKNENFKKNSDNHNYNLNLDGNIKKISLSNDNIIDTIQKKLDLIKGEKEINPLTEVKNKNEKENKLLYKRKISNEMNFYKRSSKKENSKKLKEKNSIIKEKVEEENKKEKEDLKENYNLRNKEDIFEKGLILKAIVNGAKKNKMEQKKNDDSNKELRKPKTKNNKTMLKNKTNKKSIKFNNAYNNRENMLTPNRKKNKKINKTRNISSVLQNKKTEPKYNYTEISLDNFRKKIINKSLSNIKSQIKNNKRSDANIKTFNCNKSITKNKNDKLNIKEFYQKNKDRYNTIYSKDNKNIYNKTINGFRANIIDSEKIKQNPRCIKCGSIKDINKIRGIYKCEKCKGYICGNCSKIHYLKNPEHKSYYIETENRILPDRYKSTNNIFSDRAKSYKPSNLFNLMDRSKSNKDKNVRIDKLKSNQIIFSINCKICNKLFPFKEEKIFLTNCANCRGNICSNCFEEHLKNYPEHNFIQMKIILINDNTSYDNYTLPKLYCGKCHKQKNDHDNIFFCDKCLINFCEECEKEHNKKYQDHNLFFIKRILVKDENNFNNKQDIICRQCEAHLGENNLAFRQCNQCKFYLCLPCSESHLEKYNNHNIIYTIMNENEKDIINNIYKRQNMMNNPNDNLKNKEEFNIKFKSDSTQELGKNKYINGKNESIKEKNIIESQNINCINCNRKINDINKCNYCYGYLCTFCKNIKNEKLNLFSEINSKDLSKILLKEYINKQKNCILNDDKDICYECNRVMKISHFCIICNNKFCFNCAEKRNNDNLYDILLLVKNKASKGLYG